METINNHLVAVAKALVLSTDEKSKIATSISNLQGKLNSWFGNDVKVHFRFGSSVRETILPRKVDEDSDIDYMVVFENKENYKPATLLNQLKTFVESKYIRSEIYRSHPTIVLEMSHIKFELVPAIQSYWWNGVYHIPAPASNFLDWMITEPTKFNQMIDEADKRYNYQIKRLIRLLKYWNVRNGRVYSSYELETYVGETVFWGYSKLEDYFFYAVKYLPCHLSMAQYKRDRVNRFKEKVDEIKKDYYENGYKHYALGEIEKLFPLP